MTAPGSSKGYLIPVICVGLLLAGGCKKESAQRDTGQRFQVERSYERGPLKVVVRLDKDTLTIAETLVLELEATVEPPYEVNMPVVGRDLKDFGIVDWQVEPRRLDPNNNVVNACRYRLEPFLSGKFSVPAFTFEFYDANEPDKKYKLASEPIEVEVTSLLGEDRSRLEIAEIEDVVEIRQERSPWWLWGLCAAGAVLGGGAWFYFRRSGGKQAVRILKPAHEVAYERLRALVGAELVEQGRVKEFYERISDILRHYIEDRFGLRAPERTTEEFLSEIAGTDVLSGREKERLGRFLAHCDLVKFARFEPTNQQIQESFDLVKTFIEETKSDAKQVDVTQSIAAEQAVEVGS